MVQSIAVAIAVTEVKCSSVMEEVCSCYVSVRGGCSDHTVQIKEVKDDIAVIVAVTEAIAVAVTEVNT